jgi:DNA polymerase
MTTNGRSSGLWESNRHASKLQRPPRLPSAHADSRISRSGVSESRSERRERLVEVYEEASVCTRCPLAETRSNVVFGSGNADAELMFVGEAPGAEEDRQGLPFVGRAGALLAELLEGIGMSREQVWITNVLRCRPPGNRDPQPIEIESCQPYTQRQVELIEPRVIATLGNFATKLLTGSRVGISRVRGTPQIREIAGRTVFLMPLFHPAAALRTPSVAELLREDFGKLPELLERPVPEAAASSPAAELAGSAEAAADQLDLFG